MAFSTPKARDAKTQSSATTPPHGVMAPQIDSGQCAPQEARPFLRLLPISRGRRTELAGGLSPISGRNEQENESTTDRPADTLCCLPSSPLTGARMSALCAATFAGWSNPMRPRGRSTARGVVLSGRLVAAVDVRTREAIVAIVSHCGSNLFRRSSGRRSSL